MKMALEHLLNCHPGTLSCPGPLVRTEPRGFLEHLLVGLCRERWLHGNGDSTWEPCPGSDRDLRLLGQQVVPLPALILLRICLKEQRRQMHNCFLLSASSPVLLPSPSRLRAPQWGFVLRDSQTLNSGENSACVASRGYELGSVCDPSLSEQGALAEWLRAPPQSSSQAGGHGSGSCSL